MKIILYSLHFRHSLHQKMVSISDLLHIILITIFLTTYLNPTLSKKKKKGKGKEKQWHVALTDSSESVLPLLIPFWKSKAASGRHSRANVPARRNTSGPLYERETDSEPRRGDESTRNKTSQRATATLVDGTR